MKVDQLRSQVAGTVRLSVLDDRTSTSTALRHLPPIPQLPDDRGRRNVSTLKGASAMADSCAESVYEGRMPA
ncbi:MAG: hypothetical protein JWQ19_3706 [Subtercola sp.]|nr:hypothetical protein [Subtercola sp.]